MVLLSAADVPRVDSRCLVHSSEGEGVGVGVGGDAGNGNNNHCGSKDFAPILNFGSSFVDERIPPGNVAMPCPVGQASRSVLRRVAGTTTGRSIAVGRFVKIFVLGRTFPPPTIATMMSV